jgi:hypothetical protein
LNFLRGPLQLLTLQAQLRQTVIDFDLRFFKASDVLTFLATELLLALQLLLRLFDLRFSDL